MDRHEEIKAREPMTQALKPCPYCGSPARYRTLGAASDLLRVECDNRYTSCCGHTTAKTDSAEKYLADWWNNRTADAEIQRLESALSEAQFEGAQEIWDERYVKLQGEHAALQAEVSRLTAERDAAVRRAEAAEADLVLAMENSNSFMSCEPCVHRGYDPDDGRCCKLKSCKPKWRGPEPGGKGASHV